MSRTKLSKSWTLGKAILRDTDNKALGFCQLKSGDFKFMKIVSDTNKLPEKVNHRKLIKHKIKNIAKNLHW